MMPPNNRGYIMEITINRAARIVGMSRVHIRNLITRGKIIARQEGVTWLVNRESVYAYFGAEARKQAVSGFADFIKYAGHERAKELAAELVQTAERG